MEPQVVSAAAEVDFSLLALFLRATFVVKIVMLILVVASVWSWATIIQKTINYRKTRAETEIFDAAFWSGEPLDKLYEKTGQNPLGGAERIFASAMGEWHRSYKKSGDLIAGVQQRIERSMDVAIARESEKINNGLTFLATVGSIAPFVGLFGTVWGIKKSFEEIAIQQNTNLAVVAPGIAEALAATGLGLVAAIPAVIFYNKLSADADKLIGNYDSFADEFTTILSRQLDSAES